MNLVERHIISKNHKFYKECDSLCLLSKNLYNYANSLIVSKYYHSNKLYEQGLIPHPTYLNYSQINRILIDSNQEDYRALPAKVSNQTIMLLDNNWTSFFKAIRDWKINPSKYKAKPNPPDFIQDNDRFIIKYESGAISTKSLKKGFIKLSKTNIEFTSTRQNVKEVRIIPKVYSYVIEVVYKIDDKPKLVNNNRIFSIDLGVSNLATITCNDPNVKPKILNGKPLKSINHYFNKKLATLKKDVKERNNKDTSNKIKNLNSKRDNKVNDNLHKNSRELINLAIENNVNTIVVGKNDNWKQKSNLGKTNNQNFINIPHSRFINMIKYKCEIEGINFILQEESYTSKASFLNLDYIPTYNKKSNQKYIFSGDRKGKAYKIKGKNGRIINADVNGSYNIMRKAFPNVFSNGIQGLSVNPMVINVSR